VGSSVTYVSAFSDNVPTDDRTHPSKDSHMWQLSKSQHFLIINSSHPLYVSHGEYRIQVVPLDETVVYEIFYSLASSIINLKA
jgi:zona occludens toxin (predicted ATPase)